MLPTSLSMETISRGLFLQELNQDVVASNIANTYQDSQGYLVNSLQRVNSTDGLSLFTGNALGQNAVGTGPLVSQITRLRNMFLDTQIQQVSSTVGSAEIVTGALSQINGIINGASGTLNAALTKFAGDWATLGANASPATDLADRAAVVSDGVAFATLANTQYTQLENMQIGYNGQINQTVSDINQLLRQLSGLNKQLLASPAGVNVNSLLDARDYALDKLSRLVNIQSNIGTAGTVSVYLGGSTLTLVDGAGASILQTNVLNGHNPGLVDITIQSAEGTVTFPDANTWITGGNLGGELQARDVVLEGYKDQVDEIATSVMNVTNLIHQSGYAADGVTTGTAFFTGTGAQDINVNASLVADPTHQLLAASLVPTADAVNYPIYQGTVAKYLGNLPNLLANNYVTSQPQIGAVNPAAPIGGQPFTFPPTPGVGQFTVNGSPVVYNTAVDSIDSILAKINAAAPTVDAVYDATNQVFVMLSNNPITIVNIAGNFAGGLTPWANIKNVITSSLRMNNGFAVGDPKINENSPNPPGYMNSTVPEVWPPIPGFRAVGPNSQAFRITPGTGGTFTIYSSSLPGGQVQISWTNTALNPSNLATILNQISTATGNQVTASFNSNTQTITLYQNTPQPFQIIDNTGNFTDFTGLNESTSPLGSLTSGVLTQIKSDLSNQGLIQGQAQASLDQLNNAQADVAGLNTSTDGTGHGVPLATLQQQAVQSLVAYNASLDMMQVIDQMYEDLVGIVGGTTTSNNFFQHH